MHEVPRYKLASELATAFAPTLNSMLDSMKSGELTREDEFHACCYHIFSGFGQVCTYHHLPSDGTSLPEWHQRLGRIAQVFDYLSVHWWDPITAARSQIMTHFADDSEMLRRLVLGQPLMDAYRRTDEPYILHTNKPNPTLVQAIAREVAKRGVPATLVLWPDDRATVNENYIHPAGEYRIPVIQYPATDMHELFSGDESDNGQLFRRMLDPVYTDASREEILEALQRPVASILKRPPVQSFQHALRPILPISNDKALWSILSGLQLWHAGIGLVPYALALFPIPAPPRNDRDHSEFYFALSASAPHRGGIEQLQFLDATAALIDLADAFTFSLCAMAPALRDVWEYEHRVAHFFRHEVATRLQRFQNWLIDAFDRLGSDPPRELPFGLPHYLTETAYLFSRHTRTGHAWASSQLHALDAAQGVGFSGPTSWTELLSDLVYEFIDPSSFDSSKQRFFFDLPGSSPVTFTHFVNAAWRTFDIGAWPQVDVEYTLLRSMLAILLHNAQKHDEKGATGTITLRVRFEADHYARIAVHDHGHVFSKARRRSRTGLRFVDWVIQQLRDAGHSEACFVEPPEVTTPKEFLLRLPVRGRNRADL